MKVKLTHLAKKLRKNSTVVESLLWHRLRARQVQGVKFRRQQSIENFIVDFVSFEKRIVIELTVVNIRWTGRKITKEIDFLLKMGLQC